MNSTPSPAYFLRSRGTSPNFNIRAVSLSRALNYYALLDDKGVRQPLSMTSDERSEYGRSRSDHAQLGQGPLDRRSV